MLCLFFEPIIRWIQKLIDESKQEQWYYIYATFHREDQKGSGGLSETSTKVILFEAM